MMTEGRIQKCRRRKRTWHRYKNNKMSEKYKRMKKKKKRKEGEEERQHTAVLGICCHHTSTDFGNHPMSYQMTAESYFPRDKAAVL
jgi:hypothetical protein